MSTYVHGVLAFHFGDRYQRLDARESRKRKRADGIIWYPDGFVVVDCKARRVKEAQRYRLRSDQDYLAELRATLSSAVTRIDATVEDVLNGTLPGRCPSGIRTVASLIVSWQELPQHPLARSVFEQLVPVTPAGTHNAQRLPPHVLSLAALEELGGWSHLNLLEILGEKMESPEGALEALRNFLLFSNRKAGEHRLLRHLGDGMRGLVAPWLADEASRRPNLAAVSSRACRQDPGGLHQ